VLFGSCEQPTDKPTDRVSPTEMMMLILTGEFPRLSGMRWLLYVIIYPLQLYMCVKHYQIRYQT